MAITRKHPNIRVLQEINGAYSLFFYKMHTQPSTQQRRNVTQQKTITPTMTVTYIKKDLSTKQGGTAHTNSHFKEHVVASTLVGRHRLHVIDSYKTPNRPNAAFPKIYAFMGSKWQQETSLLIEDFNCPYPLWGYKRKPP